MSRSVEELPLQLYLSVSDDTISASLVQENSEQRPVYFISWVLQSAETRYQLIEKIALALLTVTHRLCQYFQSHQVIVRTDGPPCTVCPIGPSTTRSPSVHRTRLGGFAYGT